MDVGTGMSLQTREQSIAALRAEQDAVRQARRRIEDARRAERRASEDRRRAGERDMAGRRREEDAGLRRRRDEEDRRLDQLRRRNDQTRLGELERREREGTDWRSVEAGILAVEREYLEAEECRLEEDRADEETRKADDRLLSELRRREDADRPNSPAPHVLAERSREDSEIVLKRLLEDSRQGPPDTEALRRRGEQDGALAERRRNEDRQPDPLTVRARDEEDRALADQRHRTDVTKAERRNKADEKRQGTLDRAGDGRFVPRDLAQVDRLAMRWARLRQEKAEERLASVSAEQRLATANDAVQAKFVDPVAANRKVQDLRLLEDEVREMTRRVQDLRLNEAHSRSRVPLKTQNADTHFTYQQRMDEDRNLNAARREADAAPHSSPRRGEPVDIGWIAGKEEQLRRSLAELKAEEASLVRRRDGVAREAAGLPVREQPMRHVLTEAFDRLRADTSPRGAGAADRIEISLRSSRGAGEDGRAIWEARQAIRRERDQVAERARLYDRFARHPDIGNLLDRIGPDREGTREGYIERVGYRVDRENILKEVEGRGSAAFVPVREDRYGKGTWSKHAPSATEETVKAAVEAERKAMCIERFELLPKDVRLGILEMVEIRELAVKEIARTKAKETKEDGDLKKLKERYDDRSWVGQAADRIANLVTGKMDSDLARKAELERSFAAGLPSEKEAAAKRALLRADPARARMLEALAEKSRQGEFDRNVPLPARGASPAETRSAGKVGRLDHLERDLFTDVYGEKHWDMPSQVRDRDQAEPAARQASQSEAGSRQNGEKRGVILGEELAAMVARGNGNRGPERSPGITGHEEQKRAGDRAAEFGRKLGHPAGPAQNGRGTQQQRAGDAERDSTKEEARRAAEAARKQEIERGRQ